MHILRRFGAWSASSVLATTVGLILIYTIASMTFLNPGTVKAWFKDSHSYDQFATKVVAPLVKQSYTQQSANSLISADMVSAASEQSVTPDFIQHAIETNIDALYTWLDHGGVPPAFSIPVDAVKDKFFAALTEQVRTKLASLPVCPNGVNPSLDANSLTCLPAGISPDDIANQIIDGMKQGSTPFDRPINPGDFTGTGVPLPATTSQPAQTLVTQPATTNTNTSLPTYAQLVRTLYPIVWAGAIIAAVALFFLAPTRQRALTTIGWHIASPSIVFLVIGVIAMVLGPSLNLSRFVSSSEQGVVELIVNLLKTVVASLASTAVIVGLVGTIVGAAFVIGGHVWHRQKTKHVLDAKEEFLPPEAPQLAPEPVSEQEQQATPQPFAPQPASTPVPVTVPVEAPRPPKRPPMIGSM